MSGHEHEQRPVAGSAEPGPDLPAPTGRSAQSPAEPPPAVPAPETDELCPTPAEAPSPTGAPAEPSPFAESPDLPEERSAPRVAAVRLHGLGLRGADGWAFRDVELVAYPGDLVVVAGPSGSGRSALLLAIAGRLRPTTGSLEIAGTDPGPGRGSRSARRRVRDRVAIARLGHHIGLDPDLTVDVNVRDAADWARHRPAEVEERLEEWRTRSGLRLEPRSTVAELTALEATALHLLVAAVVDPEVIVLDDADLHLTPRERDQLWQLAADVAGTGPTVIATATEAPPLADVQLTLHRHGFPAAHAATHPPGDEPEAQPDRTATDESELGGEGADESEPDPEGTDAPEPHLDGNDQHGARE